MSMRKLYLVPMLAAILTMFSMAAYSNPADIYEIELAAYVLDLAPEQPVGSDLDVDFQYFVANTEAPAVRRALQRSSKSVGITAIEHRFMHRLNYKRQWQPQLS